MSRLAELTIMKTLNSHPEAIASRVPLFILHWNQPDECIRTVNAFLAQGVPLRLCVVDNHSDPEALKTLVERLPPDVQLLALNENMGWGGAFNVVLKEWLVADGNELCIISAHDAIPADGCVELLLRGMIEDTRIGIACPEYGISEIPHFSKLRYCRNAPVVARPPGRSEPIEMLHGTTIAFRRQCLLEIGLFDERYFAYGDEHDIGLRAQQKDWLVCVVWGAIVKNPGTWTASRTRSYLFARNSLLLIKTHGGWGWAAARLLFMLPNTLRMLVFRPDTGYAFSATARLLAIQDFLLGRYGHPPRNCR
jgi:N-acetylglucosaminyl-diphospho-decaprenol L-rhamnosyltransferase